MKRITTMNETSETQDLNVEVTESALAQLQKVIEQEENQGKAVRLIFRGFG